ncbi:MAG TPA: hypothetical protein VMU06_17840 [Stellaceae bacterium]|nr:hypothetical protein [Stellaceae bacterium]
MKKRSAASSKSKPHSSPTLFIDRSLGRYDVAAALREAGARVEIHDDHFPANADDDDWLVAVGKRGWIVLTKDTRIRYRPNEIAAIKDANVIAMVLTVGNVTGEQMAKLFVKALPRICKQAAISSPPALFTFGRDGRLTKHRL